ncbi:hypothetical protein F5Y09DRAFT_351682 [Xylaria sp. FL1042]|nr:hypothetical protein F5Y09DRAFT_351682 [Xylaria sp. FL1042]
MHVVSLEILPLDPGKLHHAILIFVYRFRFYVNRKLIRRWRSDDWLMLIAVILQIANQCLVTVSYHYGLGKHDNSLKVPDQLVAVLKWNWIATAPGMLVSILARISVAIMLTVICTLVLFFTYTQVKPAEALWNIFLTKVDRWDPRVVLYMEYIGKSLYTASDLAYVLFPSLVIWRLHMPLHQRIGLVLLMSASLFTATISIMKTIVAQGSTVAKADVQYGASLGVLYSTLEQAIVITIGCVLSLRGLLRLDLSGSSLFGSSLSTLIRWNRSKQTSQPASYGDSPHNYVDLETETHKLSHPGSNQEVTAPAVACYGDDSLRSLPTAGYVRKTHEFTLSYS